MDAVRLSHEPLDVAEIYRRVVVASCGAVSLFVGTTRDHFEGKRVVELVYEAYEAMAEKELIKICRSVRDKWKVEHIAFEHRLGLVPVTEASVVVAISSEHRAEAMEAVRWAVEELKKSVPIWKKEVYAQEEGQTAQWKANPECRWSASLSEGRDEVAKATKRQREAIGDHCVKIKASKAELEKRISAFMERKRFESDVANVQEFCHRLPLEAEALASEKEASSCARVDAVLVGRKDSKSHLRVSRVVNVSGPQSAPPVRSAAVEERLKNMEQHLGLAVTPVPGDVYARLRQLEERILYMESVSTEYLDVDHDTQVEANIDQRILALRKKLVR